jgi:poly(A) polymerase
VRDLLVGLKPKDFDVATDATPEEVKSLFRRAFIIGRRFRIVHVVFGRGRQDRGLSEVIEVSTFRAMVDAATSEAVTGNEKTSRRDLADKTHVVDAAGRVLRDNVWGSQSDDAARRDFTVNAMYYDPLGEIVVDYWGGMADVRAKQLRMIGDPVARYREDPVRIIRAIRFAAKLGFEIEPATRAPIPEMAALLDNVPPSRTFDEMIKLLQTGHALASIVELRKAGLHRGVFPVLDVALDEAERHDGRERFVRLALADTDARVAAGKPVAPSFMLATMLWHDVLDGWSQRKEAARPPTRRWRTRSTPSSTPASATSRSRQARRRHARDLDAAAAPRASPAAGGAVPARAATLPCRPRLPPAARRGRGGRSRARALVGRAVRADDEERDRIARNESVTGRLSAAS